MTDQTNGKPHWWFYAPIPTLILHILLPACAIAAGMLPEYGVYFLGFAGLLIFGWDVGFALAGKSGIAGRELQRLIDALKEVRTTLSWFILLFGVTLAFLIAGDGRDRLEQLHSDTGLPLWLIVAPLACSVVGVLFVPVSLKSRDKPEEPSHAIRVHFIVATMMQKLVVVLMLALLIAVGRALSAPAPPAPAGPGGASQPDQGSVIEPPAIREEVGQPDSP